MTPGPRSELEDEEAFLLRSIEDLDREHGAGDLSDADYVALRAGYTARAAALISARRQATTLAAAAAVDSGPHTDDPSATDEDPTDASVDPVPSATGRPHRRRRRVLLVGGLTALASAAVAVAVFTITRPRGPDQTVTGSITQARSQQVREDLAQAESLDAAGDVTTAMELYEAVLQLQPNQPEALAESGWIEFESGVRGHNASVIAYGQHAEETAAGLVPSAWAPRLYLGSMYLTEKDPTAAAAQFRRFIAAHPPAATRAAARPVMAKACAAAHETLPALPAPKS